MSFHQRETNRWGGRVPAELTEPFGRTDVVMRGTTGDEPRCTALVGTVGVDTRCSIYAQRPDNCEAFAASWSAGEANPYCDAARARYGLRPLTPEDFAPFASTPGRLEQP